MTNDKFVVSGIDIRSMSKVQLLEIAKELSIVGRHDMRKETLVGAIVDAKLSKPTFEEELAKEAAELVNEWADTGSQGSTYKQSEGKQKTSYIEDAKVGQLVAFKINDSKVLSGKIDEIHKSDFVVTTKNGVRFTVRKRNIIWVKTTDRWPRGVYLALKGEAGADENRRPDKESV